MKAVLQRVSEASVTIEGTVKGAVGLGMLILVGIESEDSQGDIDWLTRKIANMRIFGDENDVPNLSLVDIDGEALVISQFTLQASTKKGNRPSYIKAAKPDISKPLYEQFVLRLQTHLNKTVQTGEFGADMKVRLLNDGPFTILIDSKHRV